MSRPTLKSLALAATTLAAVVACESSSEPSSPPALMIASPRDTALPVGSTFQPRVEVFDDRGNVLTDRVAQYRSLSPDILTVTGGSTVTGVTRGDGLVEALLASLRDTIRVSVLDARILARIPLSGGAYGAAVSSGGTAFVTRVFDGGVARVNISGRAVIGTTATGVAPTNVIVNAAGTTLYVSNQLSQSISVLSATTGASTATFATPGDPVPMQLRAAGDFLFYATNRDRLYRVSLPSGTMVDSLSLPATSHHLLMHPNDQVLYVATRDGGSVLEVNTSTMAVTRTFTTGGRTQALVLAPDNSELYVANEAGWLNVINLASGSVAATIPLGGGAFGMTLGPDGTTLFVGLTTAGLVQEVSRATRTIVATIVTGGRPRGMAVHVASQTVIAANEEGWVDLLR